MVQRIRIPPNYSAFLPPILIFAVFGVLALLTAMGAWPDEDADAETLQQGYWVAVVCFLVAGGMLLGMWIDARPRYFVIAPEGIGYEGRKPHESFFVPWPQLEWVGIETARVRRPRTRLVMLRFWRIRVLFTGAIDGWERAHPPLRSGTFSLGGRTRAMTFASNRALVGPLRSALAMYAPAKFRGVFELGKIIGSRL